MTHKRTHHRFRRSMALLAASIVAISMAPTAHAQHADQTPVLSIELNKGRLINLDIPASSVMVANPEIADIQIVSPKAIFVHGRSIGETSFLALDNQDYPIFDATIEVTHNLSKLRRTLKNIAPDADVEFKTINNGIVMEGFADSAQESEIIHNLASGFLGQEQQVLNMIHTAGSDQITLQVRIAEVARTELERFGINLGAILSQGNFAFQLLRGRGVSPVAQNAQGDDAIGISWNTSNNSIDSVIDALQTDGYVSILAEPNLTTTTGKPASFLAGGEVPIPVPSDEGNVAIEYKRFGVALEFTPTVLSDGKISLLVKPEVSNPSATQALQASNALSFNIPSFQVRRTETTVEMASGQSFAIAGLFNNTRDNSIDKFPGLGELPILGALFRSQQFQNDQTELVIIVTPYLSRPVRSKSELMVPQDGYNPTTDLQRLLLGKLYQTQDITEEEAHALGELHGGGGFILE